ncbi:hypothetical protein OQA88_5670 [Cercophora sp. LCS_1]
MPSAPLGLGMDYSNSNLAFNWSTFPSTDTILRTAQDRVNLANPCRVEEGGEAFLKKQFIVTASGGTKFLVQISLPIYPKHKTLSEAAMLAWIRQAVNSNLLPAVPCILNMRLPELRDPFSNTEECMLPMHLSVDNLLVDKENNLVWILATNWDFLSMVPLWQCLVLDKEPEESVYYGQYHHREAESKESDDDDDDDDDDDEEEEDGTFWEDNKT